MIPILLLLSLLISSNLNADVLKIALAGPLTGSSAAFGEQLWRGAQQAAEDLNQTGGIHGQLIELIKADDACEPKQAIVVANRLVESDRVVAVIGHFCSSSTIPASDIYAEAGILSITPGSTNPKITERGLTTVLRTCGRDDQQGQVAAEFAVKNLHAKRVAIIHDKDTYGQGLADAMKAHMNNLGIKEILYEGLTRGEKDFNALVTKIKSLQAEIVYFGGIHGEAGSLVRQLREQGVQATFMAGDGIVSESFVTVAGGAKFVEGVYMTFGADPRQIPEGRALVEKFRAAGFEPEGYTLYAYTAMQAIAEAIKATGSTEGEKLAYWLKNHSVKTVMGDKSWDEKGDLKISDYVMYRWGSDGKYRQVK